VIFLFAFVWLSITCWSYFLFVSFLFLFSQVTICVCCQYTHQGGDWGPCVVRGPVDDRFLVWWVIDNVVWTNSWLCIEGCHTCFSKENQVQTYMHARIKFHAYSWHKWITETISRKKKGDYRRFTLNPGNGGTKLHKQSTGGCVRLEPATPSQDIRVASSFWATLFIARVSTCRTQQVWGKRMNAKAL
jgi:hypothetical protein